MKKEEIYETINGIDDKYIELAETYTPKKRNKNLVKWTVIAACLCLCLITVAVFPLLNKEPVNDLPKDITLPNNISASEDEDSLAISDDKTTDTYSASSGAVRDIQAMKKTHYVLYNGKKYSSEITDSLNELRGVTSWEFTQEQLGNFLCYLEKNSDGNYFPTQNESNIILYEYVPSTDKNACLLFEDGTYSVVTCFEEALIAAQICWFTYNDKTYTIQYRTKTDENSIEEAAGKYIGTLKDSWNISEILSIQGNDSFDLFEYGQNPGDSFYVIKYGDQFYIAICDDILPPRIELKLDGNKIMRP